MPEAYKGEFCSLVLTDDTSRVETVSPDVGANETSFPVGIERETQE
jgi:hypothetical protein